MDGENNGSKPYEQMDGLEGFPIIFGSTPTCTTKWMFPKIGVGPQNGWWK